MFERLKERLREGLDPASLKVFRVIYGVMAAFSAARFFWYGWIDRFFYQREVFFHFPGFTWVEPLPAPGMHLLFGLLVICGLAVAAGVFWRVALAIFVLGFTYVGLVDTTNYLNHYWQVRFVGFLMLFMPMAGGRDDGKVPAWPVWTLRLQLGLVYFFAGVAKLNWDWLVRGEPLGIWLSARTHLPVVGPFLGIEWVPHAMSIAGAVFDLCIFFFLLAPRTRAWAYLTVVAFHATTGFLFNIGMFPVIMIGLTTIFFEPDWPKRLLDRLEGVPLLGGLRRIFGDDVAEADSSGKGSRALSGSEGREGVPALKKGGVWLLAAWFTLQFALPLRHFAYPGDVLWTQEGFRFSWRVKLAERGGYLTYDVRNPDTGESWTVHPSRYLTKRQVELASVEPAKILQLAHHIARDFRRRGYGDVEVRADARVSLNGHPSQPLVAPDVDLADQPYDIWHRDWILPRHGGQR